MNADYVENIIRNIDKQSYKCILVDGAWGIGKSYMVRKALEDMKDRTCFISLFGMDDVQRKFTLLENKIDNLLKNGISNFTKDLLKIITSNNSKVEIGRAHV